MREAEGDLDYNQVESEIGALVKGRKEASLELGVNRTVVGEKKS